MVSWLESLDLRQSILPTPPPFETVQRVIRRPSTFSGLQPVHAHSKSSTSRLMTVIRGFMVVQVLHLGTKDKKFKRGYVSERKVSIIRDGTPRREIGPM